MSPIRIIIIGILLYIGYLLIKGGTTRAGKDEQDKEPDSISDTSDVLVEDPVCKKLVPRQQAITAEVEDKTLYFCSKECCNTYISEKGAGK